MWTVYNKAIHQVTHLSCILGVSFLDADCVATRSQAYRKVFYVFGAHDEPSCGTIFAK